LDFFSVILHFIAAQDSDWCEQMRRPNSDNVKMVGVSDVRDINQTIFLHLIRERQPISRAEIVKATGLRAGTVSAIVNRLIKERMVFEGVEGPSSGGRRPRYLHVNAESAYVIAVDIGVNDTTYAISDFNGRVLTQRAIITEGEPNAFLKRLAAEISTLTREQYSRARFEAVGVSVPGLIDREEGTLVTSPNLGWTDVPIRNILEEGLELPVFVENDANAAAFAELWYGPLEEANVRTLLFILVVEGLGTGLIINGELHVGTKIGLGGFGHMSLIPDGPLCSCGRRGCWEMLASDHATLNRYRISKPKGAPVAHSVTELIAFAGQGNDAALESIRATASHLAEGIANLTHGLSPEVIVVGGQIAGAWSIVEPILKQQIKSKYLLPSVFFPKIRPASVQRPSLFGAIPIALQHCFLPDQPREAVGKSLRASIADGRKAKTEGLGRRAKLS